MKSKTIPSSEIKSQETSSFGKGAGEGVSAWQLPAWAAGPRGPREAGDGAALGSAVTHSHVSCRSPSAAEEAPLERATRRGRAKGSAGPAPRAKQACHAERSQQRAACKSAQVHTDRQPCSRTFQTLSSASGNETPVSTCRWCVGGREAFWGADPAACPGRDVDQPPLSFRTG